MDSDRQKGTISKEFKKLHEDILTELDDIEIEYFDKDTLEIEVKVNTPNGSIEVLISGTYGNDFLESIYDSKEPKSLRDVLQSTESDDVWLSFELFKKENEIYAIEGDNNALQILDYFSNNSEARNRVEEFYNNIEKWEKEKTLNQMNKISEELAIDFEEKYTTYLDVVPDDDTETYLRDLFIQAILYNRNVAPLRFEAMKKNNRSEWKELDDYVYSMDNTDRKEIFEIVEKGTESTNNGTISKDLIRQRSPTTSQGTGAILSNLCDRGLLEHEDQMYYLSEAVKVVE